MKVELPEEIVHKVAKDFSKFVIANCEDKFSNNDAHVLELITAAAILFVNRRDVMNLSKIPSPEAITKMATPLYELLGCLDLERARECGQWDEEIDPIDTLTLLCGIAMSPLIDEVIVDIDEWLKSVTPHGGTH